MRTVFIHGQALHLGFLGCYGNGWVATPNLDRIAAEGVVFDHHYLDRPLFGGELPQSIITGRFDWASSHQRASSMVDPHHLTWINMPSLLPPWNLPDDLVGVYGEDEESPLDPWPDPPLGFFAKEAWTDMERLQNTYAAAVTNWDARLGDILVPMRESGQLDEVLLCITASSGMPLGEHGQVGPHRPWLYEETVHVPLLIRLPRAAHGGLRISAITQPVDLLPTILEFAGADVPACHGQSLWPLIREDVSELRPYACSLWQLGPARELALRTPEWALLVPDAPFPGDLPRERQLYRKPEDRWEVNDICQHNAETAEGLERTLRNFVEAADRTQGPLDFPPLPSKEAAAVL